MGTNPFGATADWEAHADNCFLEMCLSEYDEWENPKYALIDIDEQTFVTGNTPKWTKEAKSQQNNVIENRNIGVHMVCGPIDEYVSISTDITIPGGTNVTIEVTRMAIGILAEKLAAIGFVLLKNLGVQNDNCGENKVRLPPISRTTINIFCCANYYYFLIGI